MTKTPLRRILEAVAAGELSVEQALADLRPTGDLDFARVDHERAARCGFPEVVLCLGKEPGDAARIAEEVLERSPRVLLTRAEPAHADAVRDRLPEAVWHERARCLVVDREPLPRTGHVAVVAAGTGDLPVAEEARITAETMGAATSRHYDVGVAGLHRLLERIETIRTARAVVVAAGMEAALASVTAGLIARPVVAVPTSVGYGAGFGGLAALLAMLNACAAGVAVVNVDNGFGAGYLAAQINRETPPR